MCLGIGCNCIEAVWHVSNFPTSRANEGYYSIPSPPLLSPSPPLPSSPPSLPFLPPPLPLPSPQAAAAPGAVIPDVVISCPPSEPPYPLISLCHCIGRKMAISCRLHVHSSVSGAVSNELTNFWKTLPQSDNPALRITVLWKSGEDIQCRVDLYMHCVSTIHEPE